MKFCPKCGAQFDPLDRFCEQCGFDKSTLNAGNEPIKPPAALPVVPPNPAIQQPSKPVTQQTSNPVTQSPSPPAKKFPLLPVIILVVVIIAGAASWFIYKQVTKNKAVTTQTQAVAANADAAQTKTTAGGSLTSSAPGANKEIKILLQIGSENDPRDWNPRNPPKLKLNIPTMIVRITTDHYNQGKGTEFTGTISIRDNNGKLIGTYSAYGKPGSNGVANTYWVVEPGKVLPAGIYYIWDSNLLTWSKKITGEAFVLVEGYETE